MGEAADSVIVVESLTKRFPVMRSWSDMLCRPFDRRFTSALNGVTLEIQRGEVFGLLGPNGAGKTTLVKILCGLVLPTAGRASVDGFDVVRDAAKVRRALGSCLETERSFYYRLTGTQNLEFFATLNNLDPEDAPARIADVLDMVGLNGAACAAFMTYSRGMQQKLGLARALLTDPAVLLLDEPTRSLDPGASAEFRRLLRALTQGTGKTGLLVTHSLEEARECCDRAAIMSQGQVVFQGIWDEVDEYIRTNGFPGED